jgi:hypothetical protein
VVEGKFTFSVSDGLIAAGSRGGHEPQSRVASLIGQRLDSLVASPRRLQMDRPHLWIVRPSGGQSFFSRTTPARTGMSRWCSGIIIRRSVNPLA